MKLFRTIGMMLAAAGLVLTLTSCQGERTLVAGIDVNQEPLSYRDSGNNLTGFEIDLATIAAKRAGLTVRFVPINWSQREQALRTDRVNSLWGEISSDTDSSNTMLLTSSYLSNTQILIVASNSGIRKKADLTGKSVGAIEGSAAAQVLKKDELAAKFQDGAPQYFDDFNTMFLALQSRQLDAIAADDTMGEYYISQSNTLDYQILSDVLQTESYSVGVRRNDSRLRNSIEKALDSMKKDGTCTELSNKWFGRDLTLK